MNITLPPLPEARWNFDASETSLLVCRDDHDKGEKCEYKELHPAEVLRVIDALRSRVLQLEADREQRESLLLGCSRMILSGLNQMRVLHRLTRSNAEARRKAQRCHSTPPRSQSASRWTANSVKSSSMTLRNLPCRQGNLRHTQ